MILSIKSHYVKSYSIESFSINLHYFDCLLLFMIHYWNQQTTKVFQRLKSAKNTQEAI